MNDTHRLQVLEQKFTVMQNEVSQVFEEMGRALGLLTQTSRTAMEAISVQLTEFRDRLTQLEKDIDALYVERDGKDESVTDRPGVEL